MPEQESRYFRSLEWTISALGAAEFFPPCGPHGHQWESAHYDAAGPRDAAGCVEAQGDQWLGRLEFPSPRDRWRRQCRHCGAAQYTRQLSPANLQPDFGSD